MSLFRTRRRLQCQNRACPLHEGRQGHDHQGDRACSGRDKSSHRDPASLRQEPGDLAKEQLATIEKLSKDCEYYQDLAEALEQAHAL